MSEREKKLSTQKKKNRGGGVETETEKEGEWVGETCTKDSKSEKNQTNIKLGLVELEGNLQQSWQGGINGDKFAHKTKFYGHPEGTLR